MELEWAKADFKSTGQLEGAGGDRLRLAHESLARDLGINLSAFLRTSIATTYTGGSKALFGEFVKDDQQSCIASILTRPDQHKLVLRADYSALFPLIGIALGAKAGAFVTTPRKPTEIELQVVTLVLRLILSETYRAWSPLLKMQLETLTIEIEQTPASILPAADLMFVAGFDLTIGESSGKFSIAAPSVLFADALGEREAQPEASTTPNPSAENTMALMMSANVAMDVWLDPSEIRLGDLLQLREGQIIKLDHRVEHRVGCTLNGKGGFEGQIVSTGARRAFLIDDLAV